MMAQAQKQKPSTSAAALAEVPPAIEESAEEEAQRSPPLSKLEVN